MNTVNLGEDSFWEWMSLGIGIQESRNADFLPKSNNDHVHLLTMMMENHWESISLNMNTSKGSKSARTLDNLSRHIPRLYLLELQFCLAAYGSVFATLFPSLLSHLDNLPYIEWLLHMEVDNEKYRDHLVHMFRVAFVCNRLMQVPAMAHKIKECQFNSMHFLKWCRERIGTDPTGWESEKKDRLVHAAIYLSAIFHDFGYGYYYLNRYRRRLSGILPSLTQTEATADIHHREIVRLRSSLAANYVKEYHQAFQINKSPANEDVILSGFFRDNLGLNHSVASAIFLVDLAGSLLDRHAISDDLYIAFHLAAEAAMLHDMTENVKWLHFSTRNHDKFLECGKQKEVPIATLLFFADNLELGGRPRIKIKIGDTRCTYSMNDKKRERKTRIDYDESKECLIITPSALMMKNGFIFDSANNHFVLFDIPILSKSRRIKKQQ